MAVPGLPPPPCLPQGRTAGGGQSRAGSSGRTCCDSHCYAPTYALQIYHHIKTNEHLCYIKKTVWCGFAECGLQKALSPPETKN